jgi:AraC-like DNA-binding protein
MDCHTGDWRTKSERVLQRPYAENHFDKYGIYRVPRITYEGSWGWNAHFHDEFELVCLPPRIARGEAVIEGTPYQAESGFFLYIPRHAVHAFDLRFRRRAEMYVVLINREAVISMIGRWPACEKTAIGTALDSAPVDWSDAYDTLSAPLLALSRIRAMRAGTGPPGDPVGQALGDTARLMTILSIIAGGAASQRRTESALTAAIKRMLCENLSGQATLEEIAARCGVSRAHASRLFNSEVGMSAAAYRSCKKIEHAKKLLLHPDAIIAHVALDCGFSDQSHFSRVFKQYAGMTPREWRARR